MFKFHKTLDVLTLFHSPRSEASNRVLSALKTANTAAEESSANISTNGNTSAGEKKQIFELDVVEGPMTTTQLRSILDYIGENKVEDIVEGARGIHDAMKILEGTKGVDAVKRPIVVDWNNGRVVLGEKQSALQELIKSLPKS
ncbi:hypothetical protein TWF225_006686 [Orbilia oligospora]|uniref:Thioredoxin-like fold domain-containing protein n=2 Tax=Orbilia oligospora TaxID=2813651 RepID=G1XLS9_ARTOA|nr:hypothetical protein AOL_s00112g109 [Orbilia oligospora ATCC 24927]KAF3129782.1 hypothetical protein TWF703_008520 [Orbilia oligospora]EGX45920.1 hypothetical protein AOL_s00112g109 [Orbilia oligospora ATCC 24927]KAF3169548.1 hypothetical protein TWF751_007137 [Orbilia oligospora]KAF3181649.1 hypothetical protein TWF225_006686 [Orbilia oligospora]KAF3242478.1 hypothetical protein TWF217_011749 [Orbilia oligospora]